LFGLGLALRKGIVDQRLNKKNFPEFLGLRKKLKFAMKLK